MKTKEFNKIWIDVKSNNFPPIDEEVVVLRKLESIDAFQVCFAHRVNTTKYLDVITYDDGDWNIPCVKYWLNVELPPI